MTCEELRPDYLSYVMGTMAEPESGEIRAHVDRGCQTCTEGLRQAQALSYSIGAALAGPEPPRRLRGRVLAVSGAPQRRDASAAPRAWPSNVWPNGAWQGWALAAACLLLAFVPALFWLHDSSQWRQKQAAVDELLARERAAASSLRNQVARLETGSSVRVEPIFALELERGAGTEPPRQLAIPRGVAAVVLALPADLVRQASAAEVRDASGHPVQTVSPLPASDADSIGLTIEGQVLRPGRYTVVLLVRDRTLARFPFEVRLH